MTDVMVRLLDAGLIAASFGVTLDLGETADVDRSIIRREIVMRGI